MFGGKTKTPCVIRTLYGAGTGAASQHSDCYYPIFTHQPGLKVVIPSSPYEAKGLMITAIRDDDPVIFFEHQAMFGDTGEVPDEEYSIPFGVARIVREGKDVTIVAIGRMVQFAEKAAKELAEARRLTARWREEPHVTHFDDVDITDLEEVRRDRNDTQGDTAPRLSLLAFIVSAVSETLAGFPDFNASIDPDGKTLYRKAYRNIGIAVDTDVGLLVPVLHNVQDMDLADIASGITALAGRARSGKLKNDDIEGASFTVTSLGKLGGTGFAPIINAPEVAILGVARAGMRAMVTEGKVIPRLMLPLSLSYDHRVIDGAAAGRFMEALRNHLLKLTGDNDAAPD